MLRNIVVFVALTTCHQTINAFLPRSLTKQPFLASSKVLDLSMTSADIPSIVAVIPKDSSSYFQTKPFRESVPWEEVFSKLSRKLEWEAQNDKYEKPEDSPGLSINVLTTEELLNPSICADLAADILLLAGLNEEWVNSEPSSSVILQKLEALAEGAGAVTVFDCGQGAARLERYGTFRPQEPQTPLSGLQEVLAEWFKLPQRRYKTAAGMSVDLWGRRSVEDLLFMVLVLVDGFTGFGVKSVRSVTSSDTTSLPQLISICSNCGTEVVNCLQDENCKKALDCLNACKGNDQVCSYRCITSYESPLFEKFALCILQKHNCMGNSASIPVYPDPYPLQTFRGLPLSFETAEAIFMGHLKDAEASGSLGVLAGATGKNRNKNKNSKIPDPQQLPWSWKVVCGQNPAYDYFACQHQLFYRDRRRKATIWYDPVFKVTTLDGREVWRRRHYRVRRGKIPGQFYFSVLDNGVVSSEFWRIIDCAEDLSWAVFYYSGAAAAAGTSYVGSLVVTPDGSWPEMTPDTTQAIYSALGRADIQPWELFEVDNACCDAGPQGDNPPPLGIPAV